MLEFNHEQAKNLLEMFGESDTKITVIENGNELLAYETEYSEEGSKEL